MISQLDTIVTNCLEVNDLDLYFGTKHVLKKINMGIPKRNVTAIIGPSGCGKSALIRTFNRMHDLDEDVRITGKVSLLGQDIYNRSVNAHELRKKIGMVFQKPNPFPKSIFDNVAYGLQINGIPNRYHKEHVEKALVQSSLFDEVKDKLNADALSLSGGQQQRLCIARTIAIEPEIILMDEPCSALDPISTQRIEELIFTLREQYTIVIVTHNMEQAIRVADFTGFMFLGELIEWDRTEAIFNYPKQELTSNYVRGHFS